MGKSTVGDRRVRSHAHAIGNGGNPNGTGGTGGGGAWGGGAGGGGDGGGGDGGGDGGGSGGTGGGDGVHKNGLVVPSFRTTGHVEETAVGAFSAE
jgi:hypothetical protein